MTPFHTGDSLLFVSGLVAAARRLDPYLLVAVFVAAAVLRGAIHSRIGTYLRLRVFQHRFLGIYRQEHIDRTSDLFECQGGIALVIARLVPLVQTFAPILAGVGSLGYRQFPFFSVPGAVAVVAT